MAEIIKLGEDIGEEFGEYGYYSDGGGDPIEHDSHTYKFVNVVNDIEEHRWCDTQQIIFEREDGKLFALNYDTGKTENQENGFYYSEPELYEVTKREVVTTVVSYDKVR